MDPKLDNFLHRLEITIILSGIDFLINNLHTAGLDLGFGDAIIKRTILTVLGKLQAALIKASNEASKNGIVMSGFAINENATGV